MAKVTTGWDIIDDKCVQVQKYIGYYTSHKEALQALSDYNDNPYDLDAVANNPDIGQATKQQIKSLFNQLYKYALKNDIARKDYSSLMDPVGKYEREKKIILLFLGFY